MSIESVEAAKIAAREAKAAVKTAKNEAKAMAKEAKAAAKEAEKGGRKKARGKDTPTSSSSMFELFEYDESPNFICFYFSVLGLDFQLEMTSPGKMQLLIKHGADIIANLRNISIETTNTLLIDFDEEK